MSGQILVCFYNEFKLNNKEQTINTYNRNSKPLCSVKKASPNKERESRGILFIKKSGR